MADRKRSKRDIVIETLRLVGCPLGPGLLGTVAKATFGEAAPDTRSALCALVDAERKRYAKDPASGPFIVPQISAHDDFGTGPALTPYVSLFGLSDFAIEERLEVPLSGRYHALKAYLRLLDLWGSGQYPQWNDKPWANPLKKAYPIPDGMDRYDLSEAGQVAMRQAVEAEMAVHEKEYRESLSLDLLAAVKALPEVERLFGRAFRELDLDDETLEVVVVSPTSSGSKSSLGM